MWQSSWPSEYNPESANHRHADVLRIFERCVKPRVPLDWAASLKCYRLTSEDVRAFVQCVSDEYHVRVTIDMVIDCSTLHELVDLVVTLSSMRRRGSAPSLLLPGSPPSPDASKFALLVTQVHRGDIIDLGRRLMSDATYRAVFERTSAAVCFDLIDLSERRHHSVVQTCLHQYSLATLLLDRFPSQFSHICSDRSSWFVACALGGVMSLTLAVRLTVCQLASLSRDVVMVSTMVDAHHLARTRWAINLWDGQEYVTRVTKHHCVSFVCDNLPFAYEEALVVKSRVVGIGTRDSVKAVDLTTANDVQSFHSIIQSL